MNSLGTNTNKGVSPNEAGVRKQQASAKEGSEATTSAAKTETVTITDTTSRLRQFSQNASQQSEVNAARIAQIRASIENGTYKVKPDVIAARLMAFESVLPR